MERNRIHVLAFLCFLMMFHGYVGELLLPFGIGAGDFVFDVGDDSFTPYTLIKPYRFYGTEYSTLFINSNGFIVFDPNIPFFDFFVLSFIFDYPPVIAPFHADLVDRGSGLNVRESEAEQDLKTATRYARQLYTELSDFEATSLVIITWSNFRLFGQFEAFITFQCILVRSDTVSVVIYLYDNILTPVFIPFAAMGAHEGNLVDYKEICAYGTIFAQDLDVTSQVECNPLGLYGIIVEQGRPNNDICLDVFFEPNDCPECLPPENPVKIGDNCANCTVANGKGYNSFPGDCSAFWTCVLKKAIKNPANGWVSYKRGCPCDMVWSQKTLTCVDFRSKLSDCSRGDPSLNPCFGLAAGSVLPRKSPNSVLNENLCQGYIRCVQVGNQVLPRPQCCPDGECFIDDSSLAVPCSEFCCVDQCEKRNPCQFLGVIRSNRKLRRTVPWVGNQVLPRPQCCPDGECFIDDNTLDEPCSEFCCVDQCDAVDDCECEMEEAQKKACLFQAVPGQLTKFIGRETMHVYECGPGTCWDDDLCACVQANNTGYDDCNPWLDLDFDDGMTHAVSGLGHQLWSEVNRVEVVPNGAIGTPYFGRFDGDGDYINFVALSNAYLGNTVVIRFFFRLETNDGVPNSDETQIILTNCFDPRGTTQEDATIDVCIMREGRTGMGIKTTTTITYNNRVFMIGDSMDTKEIDMAEDLALDTWYEYWLIYCGDDEIAYTAILSENGDLLVANTTIVTNSKFIPATQSGLVFGTSVESSKRDFDGGIDGVLFYRCKPKGNTDFDADFDAIKAQLGF